MPPASSSVPASRRPARLIYAASPQSADMLYATGFMAPDAFIFLEARGVRTLVLSDLEIDRGRREARVEEILSLSALAGEWRRKTGRRVQPSPAQCLAFLLRQRRVRAVRVPSDFPLGLARAMETAGVRVAPVRGHFWPQREIKSPAEVRCIRRALAITEAGMARAVEVLRRTAIGRGGRLMWSGRVLTSGMLRAEADAAMLRAGGVPEGTIVAGGRQACDPHERGHGPLRAHELIILDMFPRDARSGYYGDLTRTVVRGRAGEAQRRMWEVALCGQRLALGMIRPRAEGRKIHEAVQACFTERGFPTEQRRGRWVGFFHGTGHGLGLDLHEPPRLGAARLRAGQVFTVEPGLYDPAVGGVRHEDVVVVTEEGARRLSRFPKTMEI